MTFKFLRSLVPCRKKEQTGDDPLYQPSIPPPPADYQLTLTMPKDGTLLHRKHGQYLKRLGKDKDAAGRPLTENGKVILHLRSEILSRLARDGTLDARLFEDEVLGGEDEFRRVYRDALAVIRNYIVAPEDNSGGAGLQE